MTNRLLEEYGDIFTADMEEELLLAAAEELEEIIAELTREITSAEESALWERYGVSVSTKLH